MLPDSKGRIFPSAYNKAKELLQEKIILDPDLFFHQLLMYLFAGTRGAEMRMNIIFALARRPSNTNQLSREFKVDYKAIQYQLDVLRKNRLIDTPDRESYGALYFVTPLMEKNLDYIKEIWNKYGKTKINRKDSEKGGV